jgi:protein-S-isoprenylcysteine O-methyltransferase Ste14
MVMMTAAACEVIWFMGLVAWYIIRRRFERKAKKVGVVESFFGRRDATLLIMAVIAMFVVPLIYVLTGFPKSLDRSDIPATAWLGVATLCAALSLFYRSHDDLGRNWSISLEIRKDHRLVTTGVYQLIRHPMYSSFFLLGLAQILLLPNWFAGGAGLLAIGTLYGFRVRQEEQMMLERFGGDYRRYMAGTKRIIPWIL